MQGMSKLGCLCSLIDPGPPRQGLRIQPIVLPSALVARMRLTITSCPNSVNNRLTQGECMPVSRAIRLRAIPPNTSFMALGVVPSFCSRTIAPASSSTQYQEKLWKSSGNCVCVEFTVSSPTFNAIEIFLYYVDAAAFPRDGVNACVANRISKVCEKSPRPKIPTARRNFRKDDGSWRTLTKNETAAGG